VNKQLQQVIDAWPVLTVVGVLVLLPYLKGVVGQVMTDDVARTPKIIQMDTAIAKNTSDIEDHDDDVARIERKIDDLGRKVDRLVEIMLSQD